MLHEQQLKSPLQCVQDLTLSKVARQKWEMLQGLPKTLEAYVTVCALCLFYLFKTTTSNHTTITN